MYKSDTAEVYEDNRMIFWLVLWRSNCLLWDLWKWWQSFLNVAWWSNQSRKLLLLESELPFTFLTTLPHFHDFANSTGNHKWVYFSFMYFKWFKYCIWRCTFTILPQNSKYQSGFSHRCYLFYMISTCTCWRFLFFVFCFVL